MLNIHRRRNPSILKLFENAQDPAKVLCVPIDYAKATHMAMACNGLEQQLKAPFPVHNTPQGVEFLLETIEGLCRKHHLQTEHVFFGGEDCGSYSFNFIHALAAHDMPVIGINARDAKKEAETLQASTDKLDLAAIASVLLAKRGRSITTDTSNQTVLRHFTRHRASLVNAQTASKLRIHTLVDQLLPGFLDEKQSGLSPFCRASLWLMEERFSPAQIRARRKSSLSHRLQLLNIKNPEPTIEKLKALAASVLPPPPALVGALQYSLSREISVLRALEENIHQIHLQIASALALTPGAFLTTLKGVGITLAAAIYAELCDPARRQGVTRMASFAGLVPRTRQTGGPDKPARSCRRSRRCNTTLKALMLQAAVLSKRFGPDELKSTYLRYDENGQDARYMMANKLLRIFLCLTEKQLAYVPASLLENPHPERLRVHYLQSWSPLLIKWRNAGAIKQAFHPNAPLGQWRDMLQELYQLRLPTTSPQYPYQD